MSDHAAEYQRPYRLTSAHAAPATSTARVSLKIPRQRSCGVCALLFLGTTTLTPPQDCAVYLRITYGDFGCNKHPAKDSHK